RSDRRGRGPAVLGPVRRDAARHTPPLRAGRAVRVPPGRGVPDELRGGADARHRAGAGGPGHQAAARTGGAGAHRPRRGGPRTPGARRPGGRLAGPGGPDGGPAARRPGGDRTARSRRRPGRRSRRRHDERTRPMTVTSVDKDLDHLTLTLIADFSAPVEQVWQLWADPRRLERGWGPPSYPATFEEHDLTPGGEVRYFMTGPEGEKFGGWWRITSVTAPTALEFTDGFCDDEGKPNPEMPVTTMRMTLTERDGGTRMELRSVFDSREQMEQLAAMGMVEGLRAAVGQMDDVLAG